ncbi:MAG: hypothetical protein SFW07_05250 [Gammaproteobacteria bacterium]|nr:hypothetical protein [Gammaproteobacteria bacterium]
MAVQADWNAQLAIGLKTGNHKIVQTALEKGANVEKTFFVAGVGYVRPLEFAVLKSDADSVKALLARDANIIHTKLSGSRIDTRLQAENIFRANPLNGNSRKVAEILIAAQREHVLTNELARPTLPRPKF